MTTHAALMKGGAIDPVDVAVDRGDRLQVLGPRVGRLDTLLSKQAGRDGEKKRK